ncbi:MAG: hypothetical protein ACTSYI_01715 [Promethearchaeota archaeon]
MVEYEVFLLHDWQWELIHSKGEINARFPIKVFGSFLNHPSWQVSRNIIQNLHDLSNLFDLPELPAYIRVNSNSSSHSTSMRVALIFFPLSTNFSLNFQYRNHLIRYLQTSDDSTADHFMKGNINEAARNLRNNLRLFREKHDNSRTTSIATRWTQSRRPKKRKRLQAEIENRFLFGAMATKWLATIDLFPQVWVGEHHYNGIPLHETAETFVEGILYNEIYSVTA